MLAAINAQELDILLDSLAKQFMETQHCSAGAFFHCTTIYSRWWQMRFYLEKLRIDRNAALWTELLCRWCCYSAMRVFMLSIQSSLYGETPFLKACASTNGRVTAILWSPEGGNTNILVCMHCCRASNHNLHKTSMSLLCYRNHRWENLEHLESFMIW